MHMSLKEKEIYEFGQFRLNVTERVLTKLSGKRLPFSSKAFETLCVLVRNAGHLISKDEIMKQVWADSFVEENNLDKCIHTIRRTLGEKPGEQKVIETVRKHGYRFLIEVRCVDEQPVSHRGERAPESKVRGIPGSKSGRVEFPVEIKPAGSVVALAGWREEAETNASEELNKRVAKLELVPARTAIWSKRKYSAFVAAGLILGAIGLGYYFFYAGKATSGMDGKTSIAVLPPKPINPTNRDENYEIGIADSLINKVGSMKGFTVRQLNATRKYTDIEQDSLAAGREQQVDYVLASNYQLANGKIKVTAQLFNVATGQIEGTFTSQEHAVDTFKMQDAIASGIGNWFSAKFGTTSSGPTANRGTDNEDAYRLYLQGMYLYDRRTLADSLKAVELLEQALQFDPNYARAWAGKAHVHRSLGNFGGAISPHEQYKKSIEAANNALALDANLADAHSALCENKFFYEYDYDGAERDCKRAIELDANSGRAHDIYSRYLWTRGRFDEAIAESRISIDFEPTALFSQRNYGISLFYARRYDESVTQFKRVAEIDPNYVATYAWLVPGLLVQGSEAEAFEWFMKWQEVLKTEEETVQAYKAAYQTSGWQGVGRERVKRFDEGKIRSYFLEACLTVHTGNKDKAFEYLEKSYQRREWGIPYLRIDPSLDALRGDPRLDELVSRVESR